MRKIETQMNNAIVHNKNWKKDNTEVVFTGEDNISEVYLHGNLIARIGDNLVQLFDGGWRSNTTKSRLNALCVKHGYDGEGVYQKNFEWFVTSYNEDNCEWHTVPFESGFVLGSV